MLQLPSTCAIANGSEEMEAVMIIDILRRAKANVVVAIVKDGLKIVASRKVKIVADNLLDEAVKLQNDLSVLSGGLPGAQAFTNSAKFVELLKKQAESNKLYGAICASPALALEPHGLLKVRLQGSPLCVIESTISISGRGFIAQDICFKNTTGASKGQAVALRVDVGFVAFYRCAIDVHEEFVLLMLVMCNLLVTDLVWLPEFARSHSCLQFELQLTSKEDHITIGISIMAVNAIESLWELDIVDLLFQDQVNLEAHAELLPRFNMKGGGLVSYNLPKHPLVGVSNLQVIKLMQNSKSREYVRETFAWEHCYWYLTNDGIVLHRSSLNLPSAIVPATLKKAAKGPSRQFGSGPPGDRPRGPPPFEGGTPRFGDRDG
ncbi:uncharacterized protein A4U43_C04F3780 [Asparagus officinalis]|uniref:Uncharacterized protein n=1 Tax=Asparagus officinalis TaxID=4686 RepID=A0A5P1F2I7_ASPOF|nr:uncharacterized protein A4U43_C04F3780 [Asparagus officinalis]